MQFFIMERRWLFDIIKSSKIENASNPVIYVCSAGTSTFLSQLPIIRSKLSYSSILSLVLHKKYYQFYRVITLLYYFIMQINHFTYIHHKCSHNMHL